MSRRLFEDLRLDPTYLATAERVNLQFVEMLYVTAAHTSPIGADLETSLHQRATTPVGTWLRERGLVAVGDFGGDEIAVGSTDGKDAGVVFALDYESSPEWTIRRLARTFEIFLVALARLDSEATKGQAGDLEAPAGLFEDLGLSSDMKAAWAQEAALVGVVVTAERPPGSGST